MNEPRPTTRTTAQLHEDPPPDPGPIIHEREIPSEVALIPPLIIRVTEILEERGVLGPEFRNKFQLCLEEALRNAVIHGNGGDFSKKVRLRAFAAADRWGIEVEDEGAGFVLEDVPDPLTDASLWGENGRGIRLIELNMDRVDYYRGGRVLVMVKFR